MSADPHLTDALPKGTRVYRASTGHRPHSGPQRSCKVPLSKRQAFNKHFLENLQFRVQALIIMLRFLSIKLPLPFRPNCQDKDKDPQNCHFIMSSVRVSVSKFAAKSWSCAPRVLIVTRMSHGLLHLDPRVLLAIQCGVAGVISVFLSCLCVLSCVVSLFESCVMSWCLVRMPCLPGKTRRSHTHVGHCVRAHASSSLVHRKSRTQHKLQASCSCGDWQQLLWAMPGFQATTKMGRLLSCNILAFARISSDRTVATITAEYDHEADDYHHYLSKACCVDSIYNL